MYHISRKRVNLSKLWIIRKNKDKKNLKRAAFDFSMKLKRPITRSCETKNPELEMKKALKLQGGRYKVQPKFGRCTLFFRSLRIFTKCEFLPISQKMTLGAVIAILQVLCTLIIVTHFLTLRKCHFFGDRKISRKKFIDFL